jgi:class 3 adenylate cyclase
MSEWSTSKQAGFSLAALLADDRALTRVREHVPSAVLCAALERCDARSEPDRARLVAHLLSLVRPALTRLPASVPPGLSAALASKLPRELARAAIEAAPMVRSGYAPAPDLLPRLLRIARRSIDLEDQSP